MTILKDFLTGLQFLTRIHVVKQTEWSAQSFGRSVKFFPLIGLVLGTIFSVIYKSVTEYLPLYGIVFPSHLLISFLLLMMVILTGGLTCDGFMDTMDGVFSGRSRERMLEIMKDSRVGANGVMAFVLLMLLKWSLLLDMPPKLMPIVLFIVPILGKLSMVFAITMFPYARPDGIGKAFAQFTGKYTLLFAVLFTLLAVIGAGKQALFSLAAVIIFSVGFSRYLTGKLGGLTGDTYGAVHELAEIVALLAFII